MTKKSPLEFYDEELSRTIRQVQQALLNVEQGGGTTTADLDKLLNSSSVFLRQIEVAVQDLPRQERKEWKEILEFRRETLGVLATERAKVNYKASSSWRHINNNCIVLRQKEKTRKRVLFQGK